MDSLEPKVGTPQDRAQRRGTGGWGKLVVLLLICASMFIAWNVLADQLSLETLASHESTLREYQRNHPVATFVIAFSIYVIVTGLALPFAAVLSLAYGWYFGAVRGVILVSFASTTGATIAFLLSRYLFRDALQVRFQSRLRTFNDALAKEGWIYLLMLRLIPAVPFFVINLVMGLTRMRTSTFWWVSQVGMFPATVVYLYAGASVPTLNALAERGPAGILTPQLILAFTALGLFPIVVKQIANRLTRTPVAQDA